MNERGKNMKLHFLKTIWSDIIILEDNKQIALIDTGYDEQFEQIEDYLNKMHVKDISFILLTHFHRDHYGSISKLVNNYNVKRVYFKNYSGLDKTTAWGTLADDEYRKKEIKKCNETKEIIKTKSELICVENIKEINFNDYILKLYNNSNLIKEIYEDLKFPNTYHKIQYNENQNSLAIFMKVNGVNILLGGDIMDKKDKHPKANYVNYQISTLINEKIDIYKVPHHGTVDCNTSKTLNIYKPKLAIITNGQDYLQNESSICEDLKNANRNVKILLTENNNIVIHISSDGIISYEEN